MSCYYEGLITLEKKSTGSFLFPVDKRKKAAPKGCCFFRLNMNEKDLNLRRREREAKAPVALWAASGPSRPERERKAERAAEETACERSEAGGQVLSPQPSGKLHFSLARKAEMELFFIQIHREKTSMLYCS